ncbi:MAG: alpha/beta hydrolase [Alphaproteobacteria bacterium]|nr:alpha/beta hydrolase [Alphaproteobacteria bacterium]MBV9372220.1 alpha/beta hydrolase [Alphaproteobacteria bacterium]MBV9901669.1 alpha/beta hydrolase [Alphaproteobacteria bacterium]
MRYLAAAAALLLLAGPASAVPPRAAAAAKPFAPTRFSVEVEGNGPDVILIPGLTASAGIWRGTVAAVPGYRYHLVQVAGFAGAPSRGNARGEVVAPLAEEISRYVAARGLVRPAIVGHSMGGTVAMMVAARHPDRVGKVMVVDMLPQPAGLLGASASGLRGLAGLLRDLGGSEAGRSLVGSAIRMFGSDPGENGRSDPDVVARAAQELAVTDLTPELPRIAAPLTVVYASPDPQRRAAVDRAFESAYAGRKGAKLVRLDGSGHMVMYDQPRRFAEALRAFLGASPPGTAAGAASTGGRASGPASQAASGATQAATR